MPVRESATDRGAHRGRWLRNRVADELATARRTAGVSLRELARRLGVGHDRVARAERGDASALTIDFASRMAAVLGLQLGVGLHPDGDPVRDAAHLALLARFRVRLGTGLRWRVEVPMPIGGDHRSADAVVTGDGFVLLVEAETRIHDVQALERSIAGKQRDLQADRAVLLVSDTRHNRERVGRNEEIRQRFPIGTRACLAALKRGLDPGGDALVIL